MLANLDNEYLEFLVRYFNIRSIQKYVFPFYKYDTVIRYVPTCYMLQQDVDFNILEFKFAILIRQQ